MKSSRIVGLLFVFLLQSMASQAVASNLTVVSTIPPLAMLVSAIGGERVQQQILLKENMSLHGYSLRPSDVKKLKSADIVFWVSPDLERFLSRLLQQSSAPLWEDEQWKEAHVDEALPDTDMREHHHADGEDFHVWLDPNKARVLAKNIAKRLAEKDPEGQEYFQARLILLNKEIEQAELQVKELLTQQDKNPIKKQWIIQHQAYNHLLEAYHLPKPLIFSLVPEQPPSLRELMHLKQALIDNKSDEICVVLEPGLSEKPLQSLLRHRAYKTVEIDSLGWKFNAYPAFLLATTQAWLYCGDGAVK